MTSARRWRIGELAAATGLTVRTLHHYEHIGLLAPSRTEGNHRFYDEGDVERLFRIRALRELGLSLPEIIETLDGDAGALGAVLDAHLARVHRELERLTGLQNRLQHICGSARELDPHDLIDAIEAMARVDRHIATRLAGGHAPADSESVWRALGHALRGCMEAGEAPGSARVRQLAGEIRERMHAFAAGDPATLDALARIRRIDPPQQLAGWDPPLFRYLDRALAALDEQDTTAC